MPLRKLTQGFLEFRSRTFLPQRARFEQLARAQQPRVMMIACSDSRVDPAILTNAEPGELFMVRNVANLVPPCLVDRAQHGISAALEYAVTALGVEHIIVFGHADCGGIHALLTADPAIDEEHAFIHRWLHIADEARRRTLVMARDRPLEIQLRILEQEAIRTSLATCSPSRGSRSGWSRAGCACTAGASISRRARCARTCRSGTRSSRSPWTWPPVSRAPDPEHGGWFALRRRETCCRASKGRA